MMSITLSTKDCIVSLWVWNVLLCLSSIVWFEAQDNHCPLLFCREKANSGVLTNFEVLDFLRSRGAKTDPMRCLGAVTASECKVTTFFLLLYAMLYPLDLFLCALFYS
jgi:hypothetical protein